jgi:hypothetical protein
MLKQTSSSTRLKANSQKPSTPRTKKPQIIHTKRSFAMKGRDNPNAKRSKELSKKQAIESVIIHPHTAPSPSIDALTPAEIRQTQMGGDADLSAMQSMQDKFRRFKAEQSAVRSNPGPLRRFVQRIAGDTAATTPKQAVLDAQKNTQSGQIPKEFQNYPTTLEDALSKKREQPLPYEEIKPNSFKAKVGKFFGMEIKPPPLTFKPITITESQSAQHYFPIDIPGILIYSVDDEAYKKFAGSDFVPIATMGASLGALSLYNWDIAGTGLWVVSFLAAAWNLHSKSRTLTRISVETGKERDQYQYPKSPIEKSSLKVISKIHIEQKNLPFCAPKRVQIDTPESIHRLRDSSFLKEYVSVEDVDYATKLNGQFFIQLDAGKQHQLSLQVDQIRNLPYLNQILARASKEPGSFGNTGDQM